MTSIKLETVNIPLLTSKKPQGIQSYPRSNKVHEKPEKGAKKPIRKVSLKRAKENKGYSQKDLFDGIWEVRPHISELSGKPLPYAKGHKLWVSQFLHVINKGRSKKLMLDPENIMLGLPSEHERQNTFKAFRERLVYLTRKHYSIKVKK